MVFPENTTTKVVVEGKEILRTVPRQRLFPQFSKLGNYSITFQSFRDGPPIKIKNFAKSVYEKFPLVNEIQFVSNGKFKIKTNSLATANEIILNEGFRSLYKINVPYDLCEVKGVVPIGSEYSEKELFDYVEVKHKPEYGIIEYIDEMTILEVRRLSRRCPDSIDPKRRVDIDKVVLTFSGSILPSHVKIDGIVYPVSSYTEPVLQCYKCFRYKHTTKACNKTKLLCRNCSKSHPTNDKINSDCTSPEYCINCKGPHSSLNKSCPFFMKIKKANEEKSKKQQPKKSGFSSFFSHEAFPPLGIHKQKKKRITEQGPPSLTDPPPPKKYIFNTQDSEISDAESFTSVLYSSANETPITEPQDSIIDESQRPVETSNSVATISPEIILPLVRDSSMDSDTLSPLVGGESSPMVEQTKELSEPDFTGFESCNNQTQVSTESEFPLGQQNKFHPEFNNV